MFLEAPSVVNQHRGVILFKHFTSASRQPRKLEFLLLFFFFIIFSHSVFCGKLRIGLYFTFIFLPFSCFLVAATSDISGMNAKILFFVEEIEKEKRQVNFCNLEKKRRGRGLYKYYNSNERRETLISYLKDLCDLLLSL